MNNENINTSIINPVDYYNMHCMQDAFDMMINNIRNVEYVAKDAFTYVKNKHDKGKRMIVIEDGYFVAKMENGLNMEVDRKFTPFMMLQKFKCKNSFTAAVNEVKRYHMLLECPYIRVGTKYFKNINKTDRHGITRRELVVWDKQTLLEDHSKEYIEDIEKYDDFTIEPNNKEYQPVIDNNYNLYSQFEHEPCDEFAYIGEIGWTWTKTFLKHIFGEQFELGIKYLKVLYDHPTQALPILVLISEDRETGKTTFINYMNGLFGTNLVVINPEDIKNQFNGSYADKNIIAIEESKFESSQATEKLKNLATQKKILVNSKHIRQYSIPFYGKLIITSNNENKFSRVDEKEIRYWVRKVPSLPDDDKNHNILEDMISEIPQFLYYLNTLPDVDRSKSRMVFRKEELETKELQIVKKESRSTLRKDLELKLNEYAAANNKVEVFKFTCVDIKEAFFKHHSKYEDSYINNVLKNEMKLKREKMHRFIPLESQHNGYQKKKPGTPFVYKNPYFGIEIGDE